MHFQTKRDLSILHQHTKNMYVMAQILNYDMQIVDSFQGSITEYSYSEDCDSDTRRTISLSVVMLAPGDHDHILSGVFNQFLSANPRASRINKKSANNPALID